MIIDWLNIWMLLAKVLYDRSNKSVNQRSIDTNASTDV